MRHGLKLAITLMMIVALLAGCNPAIAVTTQPTQTTASPAVTASSTAAPTALPTEAATPSPSPSQTVKATATESAAPVSPKPTVNRLADLPDPGLWAATLKLDPKDYPKVDGSTATLPLAIFARSKVTGETLEQSDAVTHFTTTGPSWIALSERAADLLIVYEAPDEIKKQLADKGAKLLSKPIGLDALVFLTNKGNHVDSLTHQQLLDIYTGKITRWNQVGGKKIEIIPYQRVSNSGSQALMKKLVMKDIKMMDAPTILKPSEMDDLLDAVAQYDNSSNALGYSVYYYVRNMYKVPGVKLLAINGVLPSPESIASHKYPYINPFYAVIRENEPADSPTHKLFDWLTGSEGAKAVKDAGYVSAKP